MKLFEGFGYLEKKKNPMFQGNSHHSLVKDARENPVK